MLWKELLYIYDASLKKKASHVDFALITMEKL
jgi:hypothetical protein